MSSTPDRRLSRSPGALEALVTVSATILLAADAAGRIGPIHSAALWGLGLAAAGLLVLRRLRFPGPAHPQRRGWIVPAALLAIVGLCANGAIRNARIGARETRAESIAQQEIQRRADLIQAEFGSLLSALAAPLHRARDELAEFTGQRDQAFDLVERLARSASFAVETYGLSLYRAEGPALAWAGSSYPVPTGMLEIPGADERSIVYSAVAEPHMSRLYAVLRTGPYRLVSELTVRQRLDPRMRDLALPVLAGDRAVVLHLQDFRAESTGFDAHLARHGDRYTGGSAGERKLLFVGLRAPDRSFLGYARIRGLAGADMSQRIFDAHRNAAAILIGLAAAALGLGLLVPGGARPGMRGGQLVRAILSGLGVLWLGRFLLSWFPMKGSAGAADLFDPTLFASTGLFDLLRSPGDFLLTALTVLATGLGLCRICGEFARPGQDPRRRSRAIQISIGLAGMLVLLLGSTLALPRLAMNLVANSSVNLQAVDLVGTSVPALVIQGSCLLLLLSLYLVLLGCLHLVGTAGGPVARLAGLAPRPGDGLSRWMLGALLPGLLAGAFLYELLLAPASREVLETLIETQLMPEVAHQHEARMAMVRSTIETLDSMPGLADRIAVEDPTGAALAMDLWLETPLAGSGYSASLRVEEPGGRLVSRYAQNFPPALDWDALENSDAPAGQPVAERVVLVDIVKNMLHAHHDVVLNGEVVRTITVHILDEFDNLTFLTPQSPYVRALAPQARRLQELPPSPGGVRHTVYQPDGSAVYSNEREVPPLPSGYHTMLAQSSAAWVDITRSGAHSRYLFFGDGRHLFALGFQCPGPVERAARMVRMGLLALATACLGIAVPLALRARVWIRRPIARLLEALGRTHYRKVLTAFTATTMVPLLALSVILTRYITAQIEEEVEARGRSSIESAGILLRTHLRQDDAGLADDTFFYLSRLLGGADLNLYQDGALLYTSRRELFSSGLIPPRIDGGVFRELVIDGRRFAIGHQRLKGFDYLTVSAPVIAGEPGSVGLISVPLDAQAAEAEARAREVGDVILITFVAMILLMGGVGYVLAVRVSRPIRSLSSSAARIAAGDFDARVAARPRDETGELIRSFNEMARALKEQREDLERRRDYIEKILLNATIGVISLDRAGFVVTVNPAAGTILDLPGIVPGASLLDLLTRRPDLAALDRLLREGAAHAPRDVEMTLPEGPPDRAVRARAVTFLEGAGVILLLEDVTETIRSNRLAAWAEMARRIAHEIKNPLTPIQLSAEHILRVYDEKSPSFPAVLAECLRTIMQEVANLRQISAEFSTYARIPTPRREPTAMSSLLEDIMRPYRSAAPPGITLQLRVPAGLPTLDVDRSLIGRAIVNLVENALQAMPRGGALRVSARSGPDGLLIDVEDTGIGMDESARSRIFEPYFSTKDTGTGLGLAIARKAVEEHGGRIEVVSAPGEGTTMRIVLPLAREETAREPTHPVGGSG